MRGLAMILMMLLVALSGCLDGSADTNDEPEGDPTVAEPEDPYKVDQTFDLLQTMDQTWTWSMSPGMTGDVTIQLEANPVMLEGRDNVCYEMSWPQGSHYKRGCGPVSGNLGVSVAVSSLLEDATIYDVYLIPNDFTLRVWTGAPDTASLNVYIETFAAAE